MQKTNFDQLLDRYLTGNVSEEEKVKIETWLEVRKTNNETDLDLSKEDEERIFQKLTGKVDAGEELSVRKGKKSYRTFALGVAAAIAIAMLYFALWNAFSSSDINKLVLNDGTLVWLKGKSSIIYLENHSQNIREAQLTGSGLFEVTKDPSRPFILKCRDYKIRVLGTSFNVTPLEAGLEVEVLTGRVNLYSASDSVGIIVESNQKVIYSGTPNATTKQLTAEDISQAVERTEYDMRFEDIRLETVFDRIEKKFEVQISVSNPDILKCDIRADFTDHSLESTLLLISEVVPIEYKITGTTVSVAGEGCK